VLLFVAVLDIALGPGQVVLGLAVMSPLVAASFRGRRATLGFGAAALAVAALLGIYDEQYTADTVLPQLIRLTGIVVGTAIALAVSTSRLHREQVVSELSAEAASTQAVVQLAETLQRRLLGDPPSVPGLETAARYRPATRHAEVGGDWYDAFPAPQGCSMIVIGDVVGHDVQAAATMAQARGMLRGIAQARPDCSPAGVLDTLDHAFTELGMPPATAAVASVDRTCEDGSIALRWCNAGHPAPVLVRVDGSVELLARPPDRLLGVGASVIRTDHAQQLATGDTVLLYTDGLVETPGRSLDEGTDDLLRALAGAAGRPLEQLCDDLLAGPARQHHDDIALLALRVR